MCISRERERVWGRVMYQEIRTKHLRVGLCGEQKSACTCGAGSKGMGRLPPYPYTLTCEEGPVSHEAPGPLSHHRTVCISYVDAHPLSLSPCFFHPPSPQPLLAPSPPSLYISFLCVSEKLLTLLFVCLFLSLSLSLPLSFSLTATMGLLDKLWDDVLAGPQPDKGLGRLRRKPRLSQEMSTNAEELKQMADRRHSGEFVSEQEEARRVTQSIAIAKPPPLLIDSLDSEPGSTPSTPGSARTPSSFVGSPSVFDREKFPRTGSISSSPALGSPAAARERENVWTTVFHPGSNKAMKKLGSQKFDKQVPNSPTVYDWLYSKDTKSSWR